MSDTTTKLTYLVGAKRLQEKNRDTEYLLSQEQLERFAALVRADEREACAKVCESAIASIWEYSPKDVKQTGTNVCNNLAAAIRARGNI